MTALVSDCISAAVLSVIFRTFVALVSKSANSLVTPAIAAVVAIAVTRAAAPIFSSCCLVFSSAMAVAMVCCCSAFDCCFTASRPATAAPVPRCFMEMINSDWAATPAPFSRHTLPERQPVIVYVWSLAPFSLVEPCPPQRAARLVSTADLGQARCPTSP